MQRSQSGVIPGEARDPGSASDPSRMDPGSCTHARGFRDDEGLTPSLNVALTIVGTAAGAVGWFQRRRGAFDQHFNDVLQIDAVIG